MTEQLFFVVIAAVVVILLGFLIPVILQLRKTAKSVENFLKATQESLTPLLSELKESAERLNKISENIEGAVSNVRHLANAVGEIGTMVDEVNDFVKQTGSSFSIKTASIGAGVKAVLGVLAKGIIKKASSKKEDA